MNTEEAPEWDISPLVKSTDPSSIKDEVSKLITRIDEFIRQYQGKETGLEARELRKLLEKYEELLTISFRVASYCHINFHVKADDKEAKALFEFTEEIYSKMEKMRTSLEIAIAHLLRARSKIIGNPILKNYRYYLTQILEKAEHMLPQSEEQIIIDKNLSGSRAWSKLQAEIRGTSWGEIEIGGEVKKKSLMELFQLRNNSTNRGTRRRAAKAFYSVLERNKRELSYAYRSICKDYVLEMDRRGWQDPLSPVLHEEGIERRTIETMYDVLGKNKILIEKYSKVKGKLLGIDRIADFDLFAPLYERKAAYSWKDAQTLTVNAYSKFDKDMSAWLADLLKKERVHARPGGGKISFGSCCGLYRPNTSWIVINFTGALYDLIGLAHEAGHGYHSYLSALDNTFINYREPLSLAETGSTFGELLLMDYLQTDANRKEKILLLAQQLDNFRLLTYDMLYRFNFENRTYEAIREGVYLDAGTISKLWVDSRKEAFGESIEWLTESRWMWGFMIHNFIPESRYNNFSYSFGQLLVFALYNRYRLEGDSFKPKIFDILRAGGSERPRDILEAAGLDITKRSFWEESIDFARDLLTELDGLTN